MIPLEMRTVIVSNALIDILTLVVILLLWYHNRKRFSGLSLWVISYAFQLVAMLMLAARGLIPSFASIVLSNTLIVGGTLVLYIGLLRFVEKKSSQVLNYLFLGVFVFVQTYYDIVQPNLMIRIINVNAVLLIFSFQCMWLMLSRVDYEMRQMTRGVGIALGGICLVSLIRIFTAIVSPVPDNDLFKSGTFDTLMVISSQLFLLLLTFNLILMVNRRLGMASSKDEEELRMRAMLLDNANDSIFLVDDNGHIFYVNDKACKDRGYSREEMMQKSLFELVTLEEGARVQQVGKELKKSGEYTFEKEHYRKDGSSFPVEARVRLIDYKGKQFILAIDRDITERKKAVQSLNDSELKFRTLAEQVPAMIFIHKEGKVVFANKKSEEQTGYTAGEFYSPSFDFRVLIAPESREQIESNLQRHISGQEVYPIDYTLVTKQGQRIDAILTTKLIQFEGGNAILGISTDITERKKAEQDLRNSELRYRSLFNQASESIYVLELMEKGVPVIVDMNESALYVHGYSRGELLGKPISVLDPDITPETAMERRKLLESKAQIRFVTQHQQKNGSRIDVEVHAGLIQAGTKRLVMAVELDLSERKQLEAEREKSAKLESIGTLAGGLAHDFNNLLTGIMANISLAKTYIDSGKEPGEILDEAEKASLRASELTHQLLIFASGGAPVKKFTNLAQIVKEASSFALRGSNVGVDYSIPDNLWVAEVDPGQINQVINNIVINAVQAMPQGGIINVSLGNRVIDKNKIIPLPDGNFVEIVIADHGIGIPKEFHSKMFEPYFTTKQKGSGLGLAASYSIIKKHDGHISFDSELGKGSTFHIYLPAVKEGFVVKEKTDGEIAIVGSSRILVVDDEQSIRELLESVLTFAGHNVELTRNGEESIERYAAALGHGKPFDAVIMDLTMPGDMGGKEATRRILEIDPKARVIVSSGYSTDPIMSDYRRYGFKAVIPKPYNVSSLLKTLYNILEIGEEETHI